jgi:hypothetical protein
LEAVFEYPEYGRACLFAAGFPHGLEPGLTASQGLRESCTVDVDNSVRKLAMNS